MQLLGAGRFADREGRAGVYYISLKSWPTKKGDFDIDTHLRTFAHSYRRFLGLRRIDWARTFDIHKRPDSWAMLGKRIAVSILEKNVRPASVLGKRDFSRTSTAMANKWYVRLSCIMSFNRSKVFNPSFSSSFKLVVIGGGAGGCTAAARFSSKLGAGNVAVIEPKEVQCTYQGILYVFSRT